jgi:hypothetical protein
MTIYVAIAVPPKNIEKLEASIVRTYEKTHLKLSDDSWLISGTGTAQEISEALNIGGGENGSAIVFSISNYFGRANPNVWAWIKSRLEKPSDG